MIVRGCAERFEPGCVYERSYVSIGGEDVVLVLLADAAGRATLYALLGSGVVRRDENLHLGMGWKRIA